MMGENEFSEKRSTISRRLRELEKLDRATSEMVGCPRTIQNVEADNDVIAVVRVSSDSDVVLCFSFA